MATRYKGIVGRNTVIVPGIIHRNHMVKAKEKKTVRYEKEDVSIGPVVGITVIVIVIFVILLVFLSDFFIGSKEEMVYETQLKPESVSLKELLAEENEILTSYKLLDPDKGIYRIPVEEAMKILTEESPK
jgi:hypothetical protein